MKNHYFNFKSLIVLLFVIAVNAKAQNCIQTTQYPSGTVSIAGTGATTITGCTFAGEYSVDNFTTAGPYNITSTGGAGNYLTVTDASNNVLLSGASPLAVIIPSVGVYRIHLSSNSSCGTENVCRQVVVNKVPGCIQPSQFPAMTANILGVGTTTVTNCTPAGEYSINNFTTTGAYSINSTGGTGNYITLSDNSNNIISSGNAPISVVIPTAGLYRIHISASPICDNDNACHVVTVTKTPGCNQSSQYPSGTVTIAGVGTTTISSCSYAGEYSVNNFTTSGAYTVTSTGGAGNFLTITDNSNNFLQAGIAPLAINIPSVGIYRVHLSTSSACGTDNVCRVVTVVAPSLVNDDCVNAILLSVPGNTAGTTVSATLESPSPASCITSLNQPGVWYKVVGTGNKLGADLCATSSWDSKLFVYSGSCGAWTCVTGNDDVGPLCNTNAASVTWCSTAGTNYYILVTGYSSPNSFNLAITETVSPVPSLTIAPPSPSICLGQSIYLTASGADSYSWNTGSTSAGILVSPSVATVYTVTGTSCTGVTATETVQLSLYSNPTITVSDGAICSGGSFTIAPSGANTYTISGGSYIVSPVTTTSYSITGTSLNGCAASNTAVATVSVVTSINVSISGTTAVCDGQMVNLTANGAATYTWNNGATTNAIAPTPTTTTTYSVIGSGGSCTNTAQITVTITPLPSVNAVSSTSLLCAGQMATLTASGASSYLWNTGATTSIVAISPATNTTYTVTGTGSNGCENIAVITQSVSVCTGVNSFTTKETAFINTYPNPNTGLFTVESSEGDGLQVVNMIGQVIYTQTIADQKTDINISNVAKGLYFIQLISNNKVIATKKIVKQ